MAYLLLILICVVLGRTFDRWSHHGQVNTDFKKFNGIIEKLLGFFFEHLDIVKNVELGQVLYLRRYYILATKRYGQIYVHHFYRSDDDKDPHDHPFSFWTFPLRGSYLDVALPPANSPNKLWRVCELVHPFRPVHRVAEHTHQVVLRSRTVWTLVFASKWKREWGFSTPTGWVHWREYLGVTDPGYNPDHPRTQTSTTSAGGTS